MITPHTMRHFPGAHACFSNWARYAAAPGDGNQLDYEYLQSSEEPLKWPGHSSSGTHTEKVSLVLGRPMPAIVHLPRHLTDHLRGMLKFWVHFDGLLVQFQRLLVISTCETRFSPAV